MALLTTAGPVAALERDAGIIRVLICDGLPIVRDGLRTVLTAEPDIEVVATTESGEHALGLVRRLRPQVVLTDTGLPGMPGSEVVRRLRSEPGDPPPRVLVFTSQDDDEAILGVLEAGADGFLVKGASTQEVAAAIRTVARGDVILPPPVTRKLLDWFFQRESRPDRPVPSALTSLTPRERQVLGLIAEGLSSAEIARELSVGVATVRTHTYRLRQKLAARDRVQLVSMAYRSGFTSD